MVQYTGIEIEVISFSSEDVIVTSVTCENVEIVCELD